MTLHEYAAILRNHYWFHENSINDQIQAAGQRLDADLQIIADDEGFEFRELYEAYKASMFSGPDFGTQKIPLPRL